MHEFRFDIFPSFLNPRLPALPFRKLRGQEKPSFAGINVDHVLLLKAAPDRLAWDRLRQHGTPCMRSRMSFTPLLSAAACVPCRYETDIEAINNNPITDFVAHVEGLRFSRLQLLSAF